MIFRCTKCKIEPEVLHMFGKFVDNKEGMDDEGEYCTACYQAKCDKYGIQKTNIESQLISCGIITEQAIEVGV